MLGRQLACASVDPCVPVTALLHGEEGECRAKYYFSCHIHTIFSTPHPNHRAMSRKETNSFSTDYFILFNNG